MGPDRGADGLSGAKNPLAVRIVVVAEVFGAMTRVRSYRAVGAEPVTSTSSAEDANSVSTSGRPGKVARKQLEGTQFDDEAITAPIETFRIYLDALRIW
jgi:hypothetical protein